MREERSSAAVPPGQRYRPKQSIEEVLHARPLLRRWESPVGAASRDSLPYIREAGTRSVSPGSLGHGQREPPPLQPRAHSVAAVQHQYDLMHRASPLSHMDASPDWQGQYPYPSAQGVAPPAQGAMGYMPESMHRIASPVSPIPQLLPSYSGSPMMGAATVRSSSVMSNRGGGSPARREKTGVPDEMMLGQLRDACWHISERIQHLEQRAEAVAAAEPAGMPPWSEKSAESIAARVLVRNWKDDESNPLAVCLKRIDVILGNEEEERQHKAATFLQKHARGFLTTLRMRRARFVVRSWRRQQNASIRTCLTLWMHKRQNLETRIKVMAEARRKVLKRRSWREWVGLVVTTRSHIRDVTARAMAYLSGNMMERRREIIHQWKAVADGPRNAKALADSFQARFDTAHKRLTKLAASNGWNGDISDEMVERELLNESRLVMKKKWDRLYLRHVWATWTRQVYVHKVLQGPILQRMSDRNEALMRIVLRTMLEKIISLKAKMGDHWHRRGLWRQARLTARNKLMSVSLLGWSEQTKLTKRMKEVVMVFKNHMIGDCFHLWNSEMYRHRDIRRNALDKWMAVSGWDVQRVFFGWQMAAARDRGKGEAQVAIVENVLRRRQRKLQAVVWHAFVSAVAERKGQTELEQEGDYHRADIDYAGVDDSTLMDVKRFVAEAFAKLKGRLGQQYARMEVAAEVVDQLVMEEARSCVAEIQEGLRPVEISDAKSCRSRSGWTSDEDYSPEAGSNSVFSRSPTHTLSREGSRASLYEEESMTQLGHSGSFTSRLRPLEEGSAGEGTGSQAGMGAGEGRQPTRSRLIRRRSMVEGGPQSRRISFVGSDAGRRTSFVGSDAGSDQGTHASLSEAPSIRISSVGSDVVSDQGLRASSHARVRLRRPSNAALIVQRLAASQSTTPNLSRHPSSASVTGVPLDEESG